MSVFGAQKNERLNRRIIAAEKRLVLEQEARLRKLAAELALEQRRRVLEQKRLRIEAEDQEKRDIAQRASDELWRQSMFEHSRADLQVFLQS